MYKFILSFMALFMVVCFPSYAAVVQTSSDASMEDEIDLDDVELSTSSDALWGKVYPLSDAPALLSLHGDRFVNCVRYDVVISGDRYIYLLPADCVSSVMVDPDGYLWNMSSSMVSGRLFQDSFDPSADTGQLLYLAPCLGNNFTDNHNYGSPNYIRDYYWRSDRLTYDTTYVLVQVEDSYHLFQSGDLLFYVVIFLVGCCLICLWKRSGR